MKNKLIIILLVCIFLLNVFVVYKVIKYYEGFSNNPLVYGAELYGVDVCTCFTHDGKTFFFNQSRIWQIINYTAPKINFTIPVLA